MKFARSLSSYVGQSITEICPNKFHSSKSNHCAHFVAHVCGLDFRYTCQKHTGGKYAGGNLRVHEIFSECPKVGFLKDAPSDEPYLLFVTRASNVNLYGKAMRNIPQKHVGIVKGKSVYHYSNTANKVVRWPIAKYMRIFENAYAGKQGFYYGLIPGSDLQLKVNFTGNDVEPNISFQIKRTKDNRYFGRVKKGHRDKSEFFIGRRVTYNGRIGLYQKVSDYSGVQFNPDEYVEQIDHWSYLLACTGFCESKNFYNALNTYDRGFFSFGFMQVAAHTPNDNLVLLFRKWSQLKSFKKYFPEIRLINGQLQRVDENGSYTKLEVVRNHVHRFASFLNPSTEHIEKQELLFAARLIHWMANDEEARQAQVFLASDRLQRRMISLQERYELDGQTDVVCSIIADIYHQGRGGKDRVKDIRKALRQKTSDKTEAALLEIGKKHRRRAKNLKSIIEKLRSEGKMGNKYYHADGNEFLYNPNSLPV